MELVPKDFTVIEIAYYLSAPLTVIIGTIVFFQLYQSKKQFKISVEREAKKSSFDLDEIIFTEIIPFADNILSKKIDTDFFKKSKYVKDFKYSEKDDWSDEYNLKVADYLKNFDEEESTRLNAIMNRLDHIASHIIHGYCDENLCFYLFGEFFVNMIKYLYPLVVFTDTLQNGERVYCNDMIALFKLWSKKRNKRIVNSQHNNLKKEQLDKIKRELKSIKDIKPIGL